MQYLVLLGSELLYEDVFSVWETIWAAKHIASSHFVLFIALALVESYRDIILSNSMDFTDTIKFFNGLYKILNVMVMFLLYKLSVMKGDYITASFFITP
jgi:hypothetical protein